MPDRSGNHPGNYPGNHEDTPEQRGRWARAEQIYHAAGELTGPQRAAYLREACGEDHELLREVESLLAVPEAASSLLAAPLRAAAAEILDQRAAGGAGLRPAAFAEDPRRQAGGLPHLSPKGVTNVSPGNSPNDSLADSPGDSLIGQTLGPYRVIERIGVGGMGEVYRAHDAKLGRDVAIKVLPREYSSDSERLARFRREARTLASLNHPNIAAIYGLEEVTRTNGVSHEVTPCLVMELVEGQTLAEKIQSRARKQAGGLPAIGIRRSGQPPLADARGTVTHGLPLREALEIAQQIATGLEHAHDKGIIHRDLKPANVKITPDGKVKLLDFGLAKAFVGDSGAALNSAHNNMDDGITLSELPPGHTPGHTPGMPTAPGLLLGTPAYMSPEQARGQAIDKRTDIWALGCVLYEMLTGKPAFSGATITDILSRIIHDDPDLSALPADTQPGIRALLQRCLRKEITQRLRDAGDVRIQITDALSASSSGAPSEVLAAGASSVAASAFMRHWQWALAAGVICAILAGGAVWKLRPEPTSEPKTVTRFAITLPPGDRLLTSSNSQSLDLSQDGRQLVYAAIHAGVPQLYVRGIDSLEAHPIRGTDEARSPFFSPDGQSVGFIVVPQIRKLAVSGGNPQSLANVINDAGGASWGPNDTIAFANGAGEAIRAIPVSGGAPSPLTILKGENSHRWPHLLPGGNALLFTNYISSGDTSQILVERTDTHERKVLIHGGSFPRYAPTGHLLFVRAATLMAVPFDLDRLEVKGQAVPVVERVMQTALGAGQFSVSNSGTLAYVPGESQGIDRTLVWVDRKGRETPIAAPLRAYSAPKLAPDGQLLAVAIESNIWIFDMVRGTLTRLTFEGGSLRPLWTPDGKRVAYQSTKSGKANLWWKPADGTGSEEQLTNSEFFFLPSSISPELVAAYTETHPDTNRDLYVVPLNGDRKHKPWLQTPFDETAPLFSPDGKWIAYISNESGRFEIYVRPASGTGGKWQISTEGGQAHAWNPNGKELFYQSGDKMFAVDITTQPTFSAGVPRLLFEGTYEKQAGVGANYNVSPDGQRFLMIKPGGVRQEGATQINVVLNWFEELKQKVPVQ